LAITGDAAPPTLFAVQANPLESDLKPLSADELKGLRDVATVVDWKSGGSTTAAATVHQPQGTELWLWFAAAALLLALAETVLAYRFSQPK
jgi:hypothetical protein